METASLLTSGNTGSWNIEFHPFTIEIVISMATVLLLLLSSALISGSEVAYFSLSAKDKQSPKQKGKTNKGVLLNPENKLQVFYVYY